MTANINSIASSVRDLLPGSPPLIIGDYRISLSEADILCISPRDKRLDTKSLRTYLQIQSDHGRQFEDIQICMNRYHNLCLLMRVDQPGEMSGALIEECAQHILELLDKYRQI